MNEQNDAHETCQQTNNQTKNDNGRLNTDIESNQIKMGISFEKEKANPIVIFDSKMVILDWIVCVYTVYDRDLGSFNTPYNRVSSCVRLSSQDVFFVIIVAFRWC